MGKEDIWMVEYSYKKNVESEEKFAGEVLLRMDKGCSLVDIQARFAKFVEAKKQTHKQMEIIYTKHLTVEIF